jgi:hypothetical protein
MGAFDEGWNVLKDFWLGGDSHLAGVYIPPAYKLPDSYKPGDKITADMFEAIPQPWHDENDMFDRPVNETASLQEETNEPYLHGSSRPRPLHHTPTSFLRVSEPLQGAVTINADKDKVSPSEDWAGVNLGNHSMKTYVGDDRDPNDAEDWDWDKMSDFEPNIPKILQTLLHESAHRATAEEISGMANSGHINPDYEKWAHEFAANSLQRPGGSHDKDIVSPERTQAHYDSLMWKPMKFNFKSTTESDD